MSAGCRSLSLWRPGWCLAGPCFRRCTPRGPGSDLARQFAPPPPRAPAPPATQPPEPAGASRRRRLRAQPPRRDLHLPPKGGRLLRRWGGAHPRAIVSGAYESWIRQRARAIKATGKRVFLEWLWEMARPNLRAKVHSPADFIAAWKHIRAIFDSEHVSNVAWVWCPTASGFASGDAAPFYPATSQVDWISPNVSPT